MGNKIKYNCVFGGGGIRGMCYVGAIQALQELKIDLNSIAGSSVGAVFAALYSAGYSADEIKSFFLDFNINMFKDININIFNPDISISKGEIFLDWLREKIGKKVLGENYTKETKVKFKDIEKNLQILTLDINSNTPYIFSKTNTPDEEIALAVRISAGLPGLLKPINYNDLILVDGDLIKSRPAWKIYEEFNNSKTRLLEFRLEGSRDECNIKNPVDYLNSIISTIWYLSTENLYELYNNNDRYDFIVIDTKDIILFDFTIDRNIREELIDKGYKITKDYFTNTIIKKKETILKIYEILLKKLNILETAISKQNVTESIIAVNEILSSMYEDTEYIDISIYEKIKEIKKLIKSSIKKQFLFTERIDNKKHVEDVCKYIIMLTEERITDLTEYIKNSL